MKSTIQFLLLAAAVLFSSAVSLAQSPYYVVTNDEGTANTATVFNLNPKNGSLTEVTTLETGGESLGGGYYASETQLITPDASCIFVADGGNGADIAAFSRQPTTRKSGTIPALVWEAGPTCP